MIGKIKFYVQRLITYGQLVQFCMIAYLFVKQTELSVWWLVACIPTGVLVVFLDYHYVVRDEIGEFFKQGGHDDKRVY